MSAVGRTTPIRRLLVANRGEIACRIVRTARAMGMATVAVHSDPDTESPHAAAADLAVRLPGATPAETYLHIGRLLDAAIRSGADAVHPGYGFLSESAAFGQAVIDAGLVWVGPPPAAMAAMATKIGAKALMARAGVPVLPSLAVGADGSLPDEGRLAELGWPLLVKASAGGGGRGMRTVAGPAALAEAVDSARREAASAFGDDTVFLERLVPSPRHIEVQVVGDHHGDVVALFERECSVQRRHQKVVEESPSPVVGPALRASLSEHAVAAARAVDYAGAGTVEFVLDTAASGEVGGEAGRAYFLEMNTRLQVEHPVTEAVTGLDLVRLQLLVAQGEPLPEAVHRAAEAGPQGHAVEARVYAEAPAHEWLPQSGRLHRFEIDARTPGPTPGLRVDSGVESGSVVSPYYDPLLAKVVAHAPTRSEAVALLAAALTDARIHGLTSNRDLLVRVLRHPEFAAGRADTGFLERVGLHGPDGLAAPLADDTAADRHAVAAALAGRARRRDGAPVQGTIPAGFRNNPSTPEEVTFEVGPRTVVVGFCWPSPGGSPRGPVAVEVDGKEFALDAVSARADAVTLTVEGVRRAYLVDVAGDTVFVDGPDGSTTLRQRPRFPDAVLQRSEGSALAPMPGGVVRVAVARGDRVEAGAVLVVLEAMKMEHAVHSPVAGVVVEVDVEVGDQVEAGRLLAVVEPGEGAPAGDGAPSDGAPSDGAPSDGGTAVVEPGG